MSPEAIDLGTSLPCLARGSLSWHPQRGDFNVLISNNGGIMWTLAYLVSYSGPVWFDLVSGGFVLECCQDRPLTSSQLALAMTFSLLACRPPGEPN